MKTYKNILDQIEQINNVIDQKKQLNDVAAEFDNIEYLYLKRDILYNNARFILYNNVINQIIEIWNQYNGKQYGQKTKEKIYNEIKKSCDVSFYISDKYIYSTNVCITPLNEQGFIHDYNLKINLYINDRIVDDQNKIQLLNTDNIRRENIINYIINIDQYITKLKKLRNDYEQAREKEKQIAHKYNHLITQKMFKIDIYNSCNNKSSLI